MKILIQAGLDVVTHTWTLSALLVKYVVLGHGGYYYSQNQGFEGFDTELRDYARLFVPLLFAGGVLTALTGMEIPLLVPAVGEVTALAYFLYLFWRY